MAISATFRADFVQFEGATRSAVTSLSTLEGSAAKAQTQLTALSTTSARGAGSSQAWTSQLRQFDGVLASMGLNVGREIRGLEDLSAASGKTAGELGKVATAGLVIGAGMAGWKIGRAISDFLGLDKAIGDATAKLLGWGDLVGEVAGAKQDAMNLAFARTGVVARDAAHALELNTQWLAALNADNAMPAYRIHLEAITAEAAALSAEEQQLIADALALGESTSEIAKAMNLADGTVEMYRDSLRTLATQQREAETTATRLAETTKKAADELAAANGRIAFDTMTLGEQLATIDPIIAANARQMLAAGAAARDVAMSTGLAAAQVDALSASMRQGTATIADYDKAMHNAWKDTSAPAAKGGSSFGPNYGKWNPTMSGARPDESFVVSSGSGAVQSPAAMQTGGALNAPIYITANDAADVARKVEQQLLKNATLKGLIGGRA